MKHNAMTNGYKAIVAQYGYKMVTNSGSSQIFDPSHACLVTTMVKHFDNFSIWMTFENNFVSSTIVDEYGRIVESNDSRAIRELF